MGGLRAVSVFEGAGSKLFDGHVIEVGEGRAWCAAWSFFGARGAEEPSAAHGPFAPSWGRARRGFGGGASTWT
jgi:hypothetical protein